MGNSVEFMLSREIKSKGGIVNRKNILKSLGQQISMMNGSELADELMPLFTAAPTLWDEALDECKRRLLHKQSLQKEEFVTEEYEEEFDEDEEDVRGTNDEKDQGKKKNKKASSQASPFTTEVLFYMNQMRVDPVSFSERLHEAYYDKFIDEFVYTSPDGKLIKTKEGKKLVMQAVEYLKTHRPVEPLTGSYEIELAAIDHCTDMSMNNLLGHIGTDGDNVKARIEKYCSWRDKIGENISFGSSDPFDVVCQLIIDDGVPSRGHRKNMMSSDFHIIGAARSSHLAYEHCAVIDFCGRVVQFEDMMTKDIYLESDSVEDFFEKYNLYQKIANSIPYDKGDLLEDIKKDLSLGHKVAIEFKYDEKCTKISYYFPGDKVRVFTLKWN